MSRNLPVTKLAVTDIETFDKVPSSIVFAIACVIIDIKTLSIVSEFYTLVNPKQKGRTSGNGTPEWWLNQSVESPEAFKELQSAYATNKTLKAALFELGNFLDNEFNGEPVNVFGNGPEFDNVILDNAFAWAGLKTPWPYWGNQSIRTSNLFMQLFGSKPDLKFKGIKHHALHDARHEAKLLIEAIRQQKPRIKIMADANAFGRSKAGKAVLFDEMDKFSDLMNDEINYVYSFPTKESEEKFIERHIANTFGFGLYIENKISENPLSMSEEKYLNSFFTENDLNKKNVEHPRPYADAWDKIVQALDSISGDWRKDGQDCCDSAVSKIKEMASDIELSESTNQRQIAEFLDELLKYLREASEDSFDHKRPTSLLEDCKHAIDHLSECKRKYAALKVRHQFCD